LRADALLAAVDPSASHNSYFPSFATESLHWLFGEVRSGRLTIVLLERLDNTNLHGQHSDGFRRR
jgi:hypothetical protein